MGSKSSYTHQTYLYTIAGQRTTRPCRPTRPSQVTHIKHIYTQSQARGQLVCVVQLVQVKSEEKYTFKHFYTQSQARRQLVRVVQLVQVMLHTSNISIQNHRPEDNSSVSSNLSKSSYTHQTYLYTIAGQRTTCPCRPTRQSQVTHIKHIYTQSHSRRQLVRVTLLYDIRSPNRQIP